MKDLSFSPIPELNEESGDSVSFFETDRVYSYHERGDTMFTAMRTLLRHRKSYAFQLMKQFILFTSDDETINSNYTYLRWELEEAVDRLDTTMHFLQKVTVGKAFQDIYLLSRKKQIYHNVNNLEFFAGSLDKATKKTRQSLYSDVFNLIVNIGCSRVSSQMIRNEESHYHYRSEQGSCSKKGKSRGDEQIDRSQNSQDMQNPQTKSQRHRNSGRRNICSSSISTPLNRKQQVTNDLYQTKRKRNFTFQDSDSEKETVQQIYILRESGKNYKKKPNKYFRIPLLSHDVKIVEVVQEDEGHEMESTENKSTFQKEQQNFFKEYKDSRKISHFKTESFTSKKYISEAHENCKGCKYCSLLKEMKQYRLKRTAELHKLDQL